VLPSGGLHNQLLVPRPEAMALSIETAKARPKLPPAMLIDRRSRARTNAVTPTAGSDSLRLVGAPTARAQFPRHFRAAM
jgi:hypothetical protein